MVDEGPVQRDEATPPPVPPEPGAPAGAPPGFRFSAAAILEAARAAEREEVQAEIRALRTEKSGWVRKLLLLLGSFALFVVLVLHKNLAIEWLAIIVVALLIHEVGHYAGMMLFGYRDVRMFFIPLVGAAVSGRGGSAPGWQRGVVALLGPVPGLLVGMVCAGLCLLGPREPSTPLLRMIALGFLLINVPNLLPLIPLDGGRLVQDVLLARHRLLDAGFRLASGLLFAGAGLLLLHHGGWVLIGFGVFATLGVPDSLKFGRMIERLRPELEESAAACAASGSEKIPPEALDRLIAEVRRENPRLPDSRAVAWRVESLWERLQVCPPGWPAAVGFLVVQTAAFLGGALAGLLVWLSAT